MIETLVCTQCGEEFTRERTRGRKPQFCFVCKPPAQQKKEFMLGEEQDSVTRQKLVAASKGQEIITSLTPAQRAERLTEMMRVVSMRSSRDRQEQLDEILRNRNYRGKKK